ncbi:MAG: hypothetical protein HS115_09525 [Spirochaetales bacterium]|nr:hypothetical protein [Spirochaetales bacterium]
MAAPRHPHSHGREVALQALYQMEVVGTLAEEVLELKWLNRPMEEEAREFCRRLIMAAAQSWSALDESIRAFAHIDYSQISAVVHSILRIGFLELMWAELAPAIVIDDILELTRRYEGEEAVAFVNGVLDAFEKSRQGLVL